VRNNPGGYLNSAIELGSWFTPGGSVLVREQSGQEGKMKDAEVYRSKGYELSVLNQQPVVVLVNGGSASASEILAGILKDYDRAEIIGEATFGKGSVQELIPLRDGSAIKITTARWLTPKGVSISEGGLEPDDLIEDDLDTEADEQMEEAIRVILGQ
jgi:carboxyl-terminal processing protease